MSSRGGRLVANKSNCMARAVLDSILTGICDSSIIDKYPGMFLVEKARLLLELSLRCIGSSHIGGNIVGRLLLLLDLLKLKLAGECDVLAFLGKHGLLCSEKIGNLQREIGDGSAGGSPDEENQGGSIGKRFGKKVAKLEVCGSGPSMEGKAVFIDKSTTRRTKRPPDKLDVLEGDVTKIITITHKFNEAFSLKIFGKRLDKEHATGKIKRLVKKEQVLFAGNADHHMVGIVEKNLGPAFPKGSTRTELKIMFTRAVSPRCV